MSWKGIEGNWGAGCDQNILCIRIEFSKNKKKFKDKKEEQSWAMS